MPRIEIANPQVLTETDFRMLSDFSVKIDASGLNAMLAASTIYNKRTPSVAANTAALVVARFAWSKMPVTTIARIDSDLSVDVTPVLSTRGLRKGLPLKSGKTNVAVPERGLAAMISVARMHPSSKYSQLTGNRWPVPIPQTTGIPAFWAAVQVIAQRMVKARHSSIKFLQSCWIPAIRIMERYSAPGSIRGRYAAAGPPTNGDFVPDSGSAIPARDGEIIAVAEIINAAGVTGSTDELNVKHNEALWRYGAPALQEAIDDEAMNVMRYVNDQEFKKAFAPLQSKGVSVRL
jgi:hypothetical protein